MNEDNTKTGVDMLKRQRDRYRALQQAAPEDSAAYRAAKMTADETQKAIDEMTRLRDQP